MRNQMILGVAVSLLFSANCAAIETDKNATVKDATTTVKGINHIGLSVKSLDKSLVFYLQATGFELVKREVLQPSKAVDALYGEQNVKVEVAVIKAPNMLFELSQFSVNENAQLKDMPVVGPGMTHTCFQSPIADSSYDRFVNAGAKVLSRGDKPVDIGGYGVTYAYGYDPEGNMFEMEQLDSVILERAGYDNSWRDRGYHMWMSQVAIATPDLESIMAFYQDILGFKPFRTGQYHSNKKLDDIANIDGLALDGGWFKLNDKSKVMEFWEFKSPATPPASGVKKPSSLGYSFSLEVGDIHAEYKRLKGLGVDIVSEPIMLGEFWQFYANDIDGNVFSLRQPVNPKSQYALVNIER